MSKRLVILNFSHPLTDEHLAHVAELTGSEPETVETPTHFDPEQPFADQVQTLADSLGLTPRDWQSEALLINPPALNVIAVTLLAELHGRMGYFPAVLRLRQVAGSLPPRFEVAEIINLQAVRDEARRRR